jgi:hypothetical protein
MTIEMFPPFADEHCQIIWFVDCQKAGRRISVRGGNPFLEGSAETYAIEIEHTPPRVASASLWVYQKAKRAEFNRGIMGW